MRYYSTANRLRGSGHKLLGLAMLGLPSCAAILIALLVGWRIGAIPFLWASLGFAGYVVLLALHLLIIFQWFWGSDYWPTGKHPSERKLSDLWMEKSIVAFTLLGNPWFGFKMGDAGGIYFRCLIPQMPDSVERAEYMIGDLYGWQIIKTTAVHILILAGLFAWRLYA